ncbi:hypothetical protein SUGI_0265130 [Cryptomeria japonica]|nr:hypothetical protein SUGI_0265130 [Cryptomeria japonica]
MTKILMAGVVQASSGLKRRSRLGKFIILIDSKEVGVLDGRAGIKVEITVPSIPPASGLPTRKNGRLRVSREERMGYSGKCRSRKQMWCAIGDRIASKLDLKMVNLNISWIQISMDLTPLVRNQKLGGFRWKSCELINNWCKEKCGVGTLSKLVANGFYLVTFASMDNKQRALNSAPLFMNGACMHLFDWKPGFNPKTEVVPKTSVWFHIYNSPSEFWGDGVLKSIGRKLENPSLLEISLPNQEDHFEEKIVQPIVSNLGKDPEMSDPQIGERQSQEDPIVNVEVEDELNIDSDMDDNFEEFQTRIIEERGLEKM